MIRSAKKLQDLSEILEKNNCLVLTKAIKALRGEQPFEGAIGLLASLYNRTSDSSVRKAIEEFMNDLKDQSVKKEVINEIRKDWKSETLAMLVASCWQSGLDYSQYIPDLACIFVREDFATAVECFTVIEEAVDSLSAESKSDIVQMITEYGCKVSDDKKLLSDELVRVLTR